MLHTTVDNSELLSTSSAARELGVAEGTIRLMERRGELPCVRLASGMRLFDRRAVDAVRAARARRSVAV